MQAYEPLSTLNVNHNISQHLVRAAATAIMSRCAPSVTRSRQGSSTSMSGEITLFGLEKQYDEIMRLARSTVEKGESNSALIVGPSGSGKTSVSS